MNAASNAINGAAFDRFTAVHFATGLFSGGVLKAPLPVALVVAFGWEVVEDSLKDSIPEAFPHASHDSKYNALWDAAAYMTGWLIASGGKR